MSLRIVHSRTTQPGYHRVGWLLFGSLAIAIASALLLWRTPSAQVLSVQSNSMAPLLRKGDAVVIYGLPTAQIQVGDIISYRSVADNNVVITHRVQSINRQTGTIICKGDNNATADPIVNDNQVIGRARQHLVGAGFVVDVLRSTAGLLVAVYAPCAIVVWLEFRRLHAYFRPTYSLR